MTYNPEELIVKFIRDDLNEVEKVQLEEWLAVGTNRKYFEELVKEGSLRQDLAIYNKHKRESEEVRKKARQLATVGAPVFMMTRKSMFIKLAVAASVVTVLSVGAYVYFKSDKKSNEVAVKSQTERFKNDVAPGQFGAVLTLADNSQIVLNDAANGKLAQQGSTTITKEGRSLTYSSSGKDDKVMMNTVSTPRGKYYSLALPDGSKVWLNAASSMTYPASFTGKERKVSITGEAYFEVKKDASKPFIVSILASITGQELSEVEVIGTEFNIMAYPDESVLKTTLLSGSVKIRKGSITSYLKPGQQAQIKNSLNIVKNIDLSKEIAWKNGMFNFNGSDLKTIMRQLARWYDVDIEYANNIPDVRYRAEISRNVNVSEVLKALQYVGANFLIQDKKILVRP